MIEVLKVNLLKGSEVFQILFLLFGDGTTLE